MLLSAHPLGSSIDLFVPPSGFAEFPSCEIHLYRSQAAAADEPTLTIYYLGVPDTTPEFANARDAETYLAKTLGASIKAALHKPGFSSSIYLQNPGRESLPSSMLRCPH